jgi:hypothetical protein
MDYAVLTRLMIRTAGVLTIVFAIGSIPGGLLVLTMSTRGTSSGFDLATLLPVLLSSLSLPLLFGAALLFLAGPITARSFRTASTSANQSLDAIRFESAALFVLAWYVVVYAVPDAVQVLFYVVMHAFGALAPVVMGPQYARLAGILPKVIIALGLILYSRHLLSKTIPERS